MLVLRSVFYRQVRFPKVDVLRTAVENGVIGDFLLFVFVPVVAEIPRKTSQNNRICISAAMMNAAVRSRLHYLAYA